MIIEDANENTVTSEYSTGLVKWFPRSMFQAHDLTLYQQWAIRTYKGSTPVGQRLEWRKVGIGDLSELKTGK
jgi:hypothetical protein